MLDPEARQTRAWALLTARAQSYEWMPGDHDGLTQDKVAAALAGLFDPALSAGLLCCAGMWNQQYQVEANLFRATYLIARNDRWDLPRGPAPMEKLVVLAIFEMTGPSVVCNFCDGSGINPHPWKIGERRSCKFCEGRGQLPRLKQTRHHLIGIGEANWYKVWRSRYAHVYRKLNDWVIEADDHLRRRLNREARDKRRFG